MKLNIEELALEAGATLQMYGTLPDGTNRCDGAKFSAAQLEAFARLIVEMCAQECDEIAKARAGNRAIAECCAYFVRNLLED